MGEKKRTEKRFRTEFPFLDSRDCPVELETLATRKITSYRAYVQLHEQLSQCTTPEECTRCASELVSCFIENRMIWKELTYYRDNGSILGKHPIFDEMKRRKALYTMPIKDLLLRKKQVEMNIWRSKSLIKKGGTEEIQAKREARLRGYLAELEDINRLIG